MLLHMAQDALRRRGGEWRESRSGVGAPGSFGAGMSVWPIIPPWRSLTASYRRVPLSRRPSWHNDNVSLHVPLHGQVTRGYSPLGRHCLHLLCSMYYTVYSNGLIAMFWHAWKRKIQTDQMDTAVSDDSWCHLISFTPKTIADSIGEAPRCLELGCACPLCP